MTLRDRYPKRGNDPLYRARSYVDRRNGMADQAKERRHDRAMARAPLPVSGEVVPEPEPEPEVVNVSVSWNPVSVASMNETGVSVTASGVDNDGTWACFASFTSLATAGNDQWLISAWPRASNSVRVSIFNASGNTHDLVSGTICLVCRREL